VNAYLAERDYEEVRPLLERLGLSIGLISDDAEPEEKRAAYACDVTYGTGYIFGFDYLRDQLTLRDRMTEKGRHRFRNVMRGESNAASTMQRGLAIAIVDEADSVLIDDAATPLILAGGGDQEAPDTAAHAAARSVALMMVRDEHFELDQLKNRIGITDEGHTLAHSGEHDIPQQVLIRPWIDYVETALRAEHLFRRDVHYVVKDDEVQLVDQTTGRIHSERQWNGGLHQAVQTLEGVPVKAESETIARITRQRFYQLYSGVCGMTGTAAGGERELSEMYGLRVVQIPTNKPSLRRIEPHLSFATAEAKWDAVADEVAAVIKTNRPVLVGTRTIEASELVAALLDRRGVTFRLLNGVQDCEEAEIIAAAGDCGVVTIATNMAGRGTDIRLTDAAREAGGLHVVATEHHDSTRIDRQLVGRAARQGDPGSAKFFAAADDHLIRQYDNDLAARMIRAADASGAIARDCSAEIDRLQQRVERYLFERRRDMYEQDRVQNEILRLGKQSL
jgi:preprotein translocase subunit SecA